MYLIMTLLASVLPAPDSPKIYLIKNTIMHQFPVCDLI